MTSTAHEWGFELDNAGTVRCRYVVALRLSHPTQDPRHWTDALGLRPGVADTAGQPRIRRSRTLSVAKCSFWTHQFPSPTTATSFEDFLAELADRLESHRASFDELTSSGGDAEFFIGYMLHSGNTGFVLSASLQRKLAGLGIALSFDVYDWTREEPEAQTQTAQTS